MEVVVNWSSRKRIKAFTFHAPPSNMNVRKRMIERRSVAAPVVRPLACAFGMNEAATCSGLENEKSAGRRRPTTRMVHVDIPKRLKQSLTLSDDNDLIFKFGKPTRRRGKKKIAPKREASAKTIQTSSISSSSATETRGCYRLPLRKRLSVKFASRKRNTSKKSRSNFVLSESSSSCLTGSSHDEESHDASIKSEIEISDNYQVAETGHDDISREGGRLLMAESVRIQDCYEELDALVLQLHIPPQHTHFTENLDVEYLPFKISIMKTNVA